MNNKIYIKNFKRLSIISMIFSSLALLVSWGNLSSHTYQFLQFAKSIATNTPCSSAGVRPCVYPLIVFMSGYTYHGSMILVYIVQALCGFGFPLLFYSFLGKKMPKWSFASAIVLILSIYPYQLVKLLTYDQISNFMFLACACSLLNSLEFSKPKNLLSLASITAFLANLKAANILIPFIPIGIFSVFIQDSRKKKITKILFLAATTISLALGLFSFTKKYEIKQMSYTGCQLFYGPYINSKKFGVNLSLNQGIAIQDTSQKLNQALSESGEEKVDKFIKDANLNQEVAEDLFKKYKINNLSLIMLQNPNYLYFEFITHLLGPSRNDTLFAAAKEMYITRPNLIYKYVVYNLKVYFTDPGWRNYPNSTKDNGYIKLPYLHSAYLGAACQNMWPSVISELAIREVNVNPWESLKINKYISTRGINRTFSYLSNILVDHCALWLFGLNIIAVCAAIIKKDKTFIKILCITTSLILYNAFVACLTAEPDWLYKMSTLPLELAGATIGCYYLNGFFLHFIKPNDRNIMQIRNEDAFAEELDSQRIKAKKFCLFCGLVVAVIASLQTIFAL